MSDMKLSRSYTALATASARDVAVAELFANTVSVYEECCSLLKTVPLYMREYTLHDSVHVDRVLDLMERLTPESVESTLSPLEHAARILAACVHDVGMALSNERYTALLRELEQPPRVPSEFQSHIATYPHLLSRIRSLRQASQNTEAGEVTAFLLSEYVRKTHAERAREVIYSRLRARLSYAGTDFSDELAQVCISHNWPAPQISSLPCWSLVRTPGEYCNWQFIAVLLRLGDILDFDFKRTPLVLFENLGVRSAVSLREWQKHLSVTAWHISSSVVRFRARCADPVIQKAILDFCDLIDAELAGCRGILARMSEVERPDGRSLFELRLPDRVDRSEIRPGTDRHGPLYEYHDIAFSLDQHRIMSLLMGVRLYGRKWLFMRELLQNALDACRFRRELEARSGHAYSPTITVRYCKISGAEIIEVEDNGIGMDMAMVKKYFAKLGISYYSSSEFLQEVGSHGMTFRPISQFGIGFLSCFMAVSQVEVTSMRYTGRTPPVQFVVSGEGSLFWFKHIADAKRGTTVRLTLNIPLEQLLASDAFPELSRTSSAADPPESRFARMVHRLLYHSEIRPRVEVDDKPLRIAQSSLAMPVEAERKGMLAVSLETVDFGVSGLAGSARVFLLCDRRGRLVMERTDTNTDDDDDDEKSELLHVGGAIQSTTTTVLRSGNTQTSWHATIDTAGRWSQQGVLVPSKLIGGYGRMGAVEPRTPVTLPFPIQYDLNLDGSFVFALSVDRSAAIESDENARVAHAFRESIARAVLKKVGSSEVAKNRSFFRQLYAMGQLEYLVP